MSTSRITLQNLYDLFFKKDLVALSKSKPKSPPPTRYGYDPITPFSKLLLSVVSPQSKGKLLKELRADDFQLEQIERKAEELDPDYQEKLDNGRLGFYMENFVSWYGICPICQEPTLRKYFQSNVPVVDFVCINKEYHLQTNTCFLFQLKISLTNDYFSFLKQTISVGSRRYGEIPHSVKGSDSLSMKRVVPGYICLKLNRTRLFQVYQIDPNESFILVPDYQSFLNLSYYEYLNTKDKYGKDMISWNPSMFSTPAVDFILSTLMVGHKFFDEEIIKNPY